MIDDLNLKSSPQDPAAPSLQVAGAGRTPVRRAPEEPHLLDYARIVVKRRRIALTAFALVALTAAVYTLTATPIYQGRVQLLIEAEDQNVVNFQQVVDEAQSRQDYYQTQYRLLQSRSVAKKTLDDL